MIETHKIGNFSFDHHGDVPHGIKYMTDHWESQVVKDAMHAARTAGREEGHEFKMDGHNYKMYHDGEYKYFLKAA